MNEFLFPFLNNIPTKLMQISSFGGVYLASFIVILSSISLTYWQQNKQIALVIISLYTALFAYGYIRINYTTLVKNDSIIVRLVQPNIPQNIKHTYEGKLVALKEAINMSKDNLSDNISVVIWPEAAVDFLLETNKQMPILQNFLNENQVLISGALRLEKKKYLIHC